MQRVLADGGITGNRLTYVGHRGFPWLARPAGRVQQWTTLVLAVPSLTGCQGVQSILDPAGPMAREVALVWWVMCGFALLVLVLVSALWLYAMLRAPRTVSPERERRVQRRWLVGGGLLLPTVSVVLLLVYGLSAGRGLLPPLPVIGGEQPLRIEVTGHQWWWEVRYPDSGVVTANQLIVPVGRPLDIEVGSADVIHAFWVPKLGGKLDMMPGRRHVLRLQADEAGVFRGQCTEFCGTQHAHMILHVEAQAPDAFTAWIAARAEREIAAPAPGSAGEVYASRCGLCHRVAGISQGQRAPDLSDLASRPTLGAGVIANDAEGLRRWLREHQTLKPGNAMPSHDVVDDADLDAIAIWLESLAP